MKALSSLLLVSLGIGVAAPAAARPPVRVAAWPGVSDVLLNVRVPAMTAAWLNDSEEPGSVIVFPKFRTGSEVTGGVPRTRFAISVVCPGTDQANLDYCALNPTVTLKAHWVCPGGDGNVCAEADFHLTATINGTVTFGTEGGLSSSNDQLAFPPCNRGYLIAWVVKDAISDQPIKFDGLIGHSLHNGQNGDWTYLGVPIQAGDGIINTGDPTADDVGGALAFDGSHYRALTGTVFGAVRYQQNELEPLKPNSPLVPTATNRTDLIFLTLDVLSNRPNEPTYVDLQFYNEKEDLLSGSASFICWRDVENIEDIQEELDSDFGLAGLVTGTASKLDGSSRTLIALVETDETAALEVSVRKYAYTLFNNSVPVSTTFYPSGVPAP